MKSTIEDNATIKKLYIAGKHIELRSANVAFKPIIIREGHVILFFSQKEEIKAKKILTDLCLTNEKYVVLIDASCGNKLSASKA